MEKLAIDGGKPIRTEKWSPWPSFAADEIEAVSRVLNSGKVNYWTGEVHTLSDGTKLRGENGLFEHEFSKYIGSAYAISLANGSLALELALHVLDIGHDDEVIVTNRTFIASASACAVSGARPVFADIDPESQNITLEAIKAVFTERTQAIICVHLAGWACEMDEIMEFAKAHDLKVIEDCAQCLGGMYKGRMLGSFGHVAAFSFCQDKILTTGGEGGMITTDDPELYRQAWSYKDHGKDFDIFNRPLNHPLADKTKNPSFYTSIGTNWRMTEMQAAIGRKQLSKMPEWTRIRRKHAAMLDRGFSGIPGLRLLIPPEHIYHAYYKYYCMVKPECLAEGWTRQRIIDAVSAEGVVCQYGSAWGVGLEDGWKDIYNPITGKHYDYRLTGHLPNDYAVGTSSLMFQVHPTLDERAMEDTITAVAKVMKAACRNQGW